MIGCGPSGMSVLYNLGKLTDAEIPEIVCYEKQDTVGGCGIPLGEQVSTVLKVYKSCRKILIKQKGNASQEKAPLFKLLWKMKVRI